MSNSSRHNEDVSTESGKEGGQDHAVDTPLEGRVILKHRLEHFTWAWFALPLSTAGIGVLLAGTPHRFPGLNTIGKLYFISALAFHAAACVGLTARFIMYPRMVRCSFVHPMESLFIPTAVLSLANLLACAWIYGSPHCGPWFTTTVRVLFWIYIAIAFVSAVLQYLYLFSTPVHRLDIQNMTPAWILPIFPVLLGSVVASIIAPGQPPMSCLTIIICGITSLGLGWTVAFLMYALYLYRLTTMGLPAPNLRPGMFIAVGPPAFTGLALVNFGSALYNVTGYGYFNGRSEAIKILQTVADFIAIFLWAFALWFFCITLIAVLSGSRSMSFHLVWWALVFPNIALALVTGRIGQVLESEGIKWVASMMTLFLVAAWIFVFFTNVRAVLKGQIMMAGKDEDKECHTDNHS